MKREIKVTSVFPFMLIMLFAMIGTSNADFEGTIGTRFTITDSGFGTKKPRVYLKYEKKPGVVKKVYAKVEEWSDTSITSLWTRTLSPGTYNLWVKPNTQGALPVAEGTFTVMNAVIDEVTPSTLTPDATITINGQFFTNKKPRVYLKDLISQKRKGCRVLSSTMDPETGVSSLSFFAPKWGSGSYEVDLQNPVGKTSFTLVSISGKVTDSSTGDGIAGVTVNLDGTNSNSVSTDDDGTYIFTNVQNGSYTITPLKSGYTFLPQGITATMNNSDVAQQDFVGTLVARPSTQLTLTAYDFADSDIPTIASNFSMIDTSLAKASQVQQIKRLNSNFKAVFYRDAMTFQQGATEDWYVHDAVTGSRVIDKDWGWILMDISNPDYKTALANYLVTKLNDNPMFDGVFFDDVWSSISSSDFYRAGTTEQAVLPETYIDSFNANMLALISFVKSKISPKLLILNTSFAATNYLAAADGQMNESFGHANWQSFSEWYGIWWSQLDNMIDGANSGKIYLAQSGIIDGATQDQITQTERYCFTLFLLGASENTYFYFKPSMSYQGVTLYPEWSKDIGVPLGGYYVRSPSVLEREYSKALVIVNSSTSPVTIDLGSSFINLDGNIVNSVTLSSHQGEILEKIDTTPPAALTSGAPD